MEEIEEMKNVRFTWPQGCLMSPQYQLFFCREMDNFSRRMLGLTALTLKHQSFWVVPKKIPPNSPVSLFEREEQRERVGMEEIILPQKQKGESRKLKSGQCHGRKWHLSSQFT